MKRACAGDGGLRDAAGAIDDEDDALAGDAIGRDRPGDGDEHAADSEQADERGGQRDPAATQGGHEDEERDGEDEPEQLGAAKGHDARPLRSDREGDPMRSDRVPERRLIISHSAASKINTPASSQGATPTPRRCGVPAASVVFAPPAMGEKSSGRPGRRSDSSSSPTLTVKASVRRSFPPPV